MLCEGGVDFAIRSNYDRRVQGEAGEAGRLMERLEQTEAAYEYSMEVAGDKRGRKKRTAKLDVKYGKVRLKRPEWIGGAGKCYHEEQEVYVVQAKEQAETIPAGEKGIEWRLYTSHELTGREAAEKILGYYQKRWVIEDLFRTLKSEGLNYEASELESGKALRKLLVMALMAAIQILQLRQARDGQTEQETSQVFSGEQVECMRDLLPKLEGKTEKQKNPWPPSNSVGKLDNGAAWRLERVQKPTPTRSDYPLRRLDQFPRYIQRLAARQRCV